MGSKLKRSLAMLLTVLMLVSMVPVSAMATESGHDHEEAAHIHTASTASAPEGSDPEDATEPVPEVTDPPPANPVPTQDAACYQPGDANSDGEVHVNDAFYVLYHSLLPEDYPMNHNGDYDGDGDIDKDDAIQALKYVHHLEDLPAYAHQYLEPTWNWELDGGEVYVTATFRCACQQGETLTFDSDNDFEVEIAETAATCTEAGHISHTASVVVNGVTYTNTYTVTHSALGHDIAGEASCTEGAACGRCDYKLDPKGHSWGEPVLTEGDCQTEAVLTRTCSDCGATESEEQTQISYSHDWEYTGDVAVEGTPCAYAKTYKCSVCDEVMTDGELFYKHTYTAALTTEATCQTPGEQTLTCSVCGDKATKPVEKNPEAHTWTLSKTETDENGIVTQTYTCTCGKSKTALDASAAAVSKEALTDADELKVSVNDKDVSISMDETAVYKLNGSISINIVVVTDDNATENLSQAQKAQIGDNPVYDFTITDENGPVADFGAGEITVSLPYTLKDGDDVDCIDVWYISDAGVTRMEGTYSNGYVTFTTNHFSYYTVTQLTPAERCEHYGHALQTLEKAASCTSAGYKMEVCQRCGYEASSDTYPMLEHAYTTEVTSATCNQNGAEVKTCTNCGDKSITTLFKLNHVMVLSESVAATCTEGGKDVYICSNGCNYTQTEQHPALGHDHQNTETVAPTCTTVGYDTFTCSRCGDTLRRNEQPALGHSYYEAENAWSWTEDYAAANVTLVCNHDESHTLTLKAVVTESVQDASCTAAGTTTYTAKVTYNNVSYENVQQSQQSALGHATASEEWQTTAAMHYRTCDACGIRIEQADHNWGGAEITVAPSCVSAGKATYACTVCGYSRQETVPATGIHSDTDADGSCDICGFREETCTHNPTIEKLMDLTGYNVCEGTRIIEVSCACGKVKEYYGEEYVCNWAEGTSYEKELDNGSIMHVSVTACQDCGIVIESGVQGGYFVDEICRYENIFYEKVSIGDKTIIDRENRDVFDMGHSLYGNITDLGTIAVDGFCGAELNVTECRCGGWRVDVSNYHCQWVDIECDELNTTKQLCTECGATLTTVTHTEYEGCFYTQYWDMTLEFNGEALSTVNAHLRSESHYYTLTNYVMDGDSCTDGIALTYTCLECGDVHEDYTYYHSTDLEVVTDLSSWGNPCMVGIVQFSCPCGTEYDYGVLFNDSTTYQDHDWTVIREEDGTTVSACVNCGYTLTSVMTVSEKKDDCEFTVLYTDTISDGGEHSVTAYRSESFTDHDFIETQTLLGDSCEDGVRYESICQDCGYLNYRDIYYNHNGILVDTIDLSEFGGCNTKYEVYECLCGHSGWYSYESEDCYWEFVEGGENYEISICPNCGITRRWSYQYQIVDDCTMTIAHTFTYSKDGKVLDSMSYTNTEHSHRYVQEATLREGSTTCDDGYDVKGTCVKCGHTYENLNCYGCTYLCTDIATSPDGLLCGTLVVESRSCACGRVSGTETYWEDGSCDFYTHRNEETGEWIEICDNCGVERKSVWVDIIPGQHPCSYCEIGNVSFFKDGNCVFSYETRNTVYEHDWNSSYQMVDGAESCSDGYTVQSTCFVCGSVGEEFGFHYYNDCAARRIAKTLAVSREDICGDIYQEDWSCACGANQFVEYATSCDFVADGIDEVTGAEKFRCLNCDLRYDRLVVSTSVPGSTCQVSTTRTTNYYVGDELLLSNSSTSITEDHKIVTGFRLVNETCSEGYYNYDYCANCKQIFWESDEVQYDDCYSFAYRVDYENIYDAGCGLSYAETYSCACGRNKHTELWSPCNFIEVSSDDNGNELRVCADCGIEQRITRTETPVEGTTCDYLISWTHQFYLGDEFLGSYVSTDIHQDHSLVYKFTCLGNTCDEGYTVRSECALCGALNWADDEVRYGCETYYNQDYSTTYFADSGVCAPFYAVDHTCACGRLHYNRIENDSCSFQWVEAEDVGYEQCIYCGLIREQQRTNELVDWPNCMTYVDEVWTFRMGDTVLGQFDIHDQWESHTNLYTYELLGQTCDEGYNKVATCYYCGKQETFETEYGCWAQPVAMQVILERDDICGSVYFNTNSCACGNDQYTSWTYSCNFDDAYHDAETGGSYAQCPDCGLIRKYYTETVYDTETCTAKDLTHFKFYFNGTECASHTVESTREYHHTTATFNMLGNRCTDGYYVVHQCKYCDYSRTEEDLRFDHDAFETAVHEISDPGCHGITLIEAACPCGQRQMHWWGNACSFNWTGNTDPDGYSLWECAECGLQYSSFQTDYVQDVATCSYTCNQNYRFYRDGQLLQTVVLPHRDTSHYHVMTSASLNDPELGCEGGYTITLQCPICLDVQISTSEAGDAGHTRHDTDLIYVQLLGGCNTTWYFDSCACGKYTGYGCYENSCSNDYHYETAEIGGITHEIETRTCTDCGFEVVTDSYSQPTEDPCKILVHKEVTFRYAGNEVKTYTVEQEEPNHDLYPVNAALLEGNTNCDQGVMVTYGCTRCDHTEEYEQHGHFTYADEVHDLTTYGSVHGGELAHFTCACGYASRYDFQNMTCDLDRQEIANFIDGVIVDEWHDTAEGSIWLDSTAWLIKCAVTDPQCGLTIRMSEYWLADETGCSATEYQIWQLGYDEATGTCQETICIPTGETAAYHSYVRSEISETDADGNYISGFRNDCSVCGSYYIDQHVSYADGTHRSYIDAVNTLNDGKTKERHSYYYYDRIVNGCAYETEAYDAFVEANGESTWHRYVYMYESADPCYYTVLHTSHTGESYTSNGWQHHTVQEWIDEPTCSQYGHYVFKCVVCGNTEAERFDEEPRGHYWEYDYVLECYKCYWCGMTNSNGADGSIVLEDFSDDDFYIIGYWAKNSQPFDPYAAVVKYNTASGEEEVVLLNGIDFTYMTEELDNIVAVSADKAQVDASVRAALGDYTGSYALRIIFVPADDQGIMDYAITFDTCYTEDWADPDPSESTEATEVPTYPEEPTELTEPEA